MIKPFKINENITRNMNLGENDIYRKFSKQFDNLFNSEEIAKDKEEFENIYVSDNDFEEQIKRFRNSETNMAKFCVGYTGIGKSTSIRYCFGLGVSNEASFDLQKKEVVFPTFLDGYQVEDIKRFDLAGRIAAVCTGLEEKHPELRKLLQSVDGKREFYDFIRRHTAFALENNNPVEEMKMSQEELVENRLDGAYKMNPYEYQANRLKFYIKKNYDKYERLIIILDDMESLPEDYQRETIGKYLKFYKCMQNTDYPENHNYYINLIISVRPHTYRILNNNRRIEAFTISEPPILKNRAVDLEEIFKKRFDYYTENNSRIIGNVETWKKCYDELMGMNRAFGGEYKEMIRNLCFMNVRESLASYSRVFANRFWIQKNKFKEDSFSVSSSEYCFNNINVIRALACNEEAYYWGDNNCIIPNIFQTSETEDLSIFCLLVIRYFKRKHGNEVYGLNASCLKDVKNEWENIIGASIVSKFYKALGFLFEQKILRKSIIDIDDMKTIDTIESLKDDSRLYLSPRGYELYNMLNRDSVLLEMLRENVWRDYENRSNYSRKCSSDLLREGKQNDIFKDLLEYIDYIRENEDNVLSTVKILDNGQAYMRAFGATPVVQDLLKGVEKSLNYSGFMYNPEIEIYYKEIEKNVNKMMRNLV